MDPRLRADETLARARARGAFVVTPDNATSPMDASTTLRIPRDIVDGSDPGDHDPDSTVVLPHPQQQAAPRQGYPQGGQQQDSDGWPTTDYAQQAPPEPYHAQRGPNEFGPLGSQATQHFPQSY